jgi:heme-degrading monooxygenase HmoA
MADIYTNGRWQPNPGCEHAFVDAWKQFATWASSMPGAGRLTLVRDLANPERFTSFGRWESIEQVRAWKSSPEFRERMAHVLQHVSDFQPSELEVIAAAEQGAATATEATAV